MHNVFEFGEEAQREKVLNALSLTRLWYGKHHAFLQLEMWQT